ncbi:hypothetical protein PoB_001959400 [Plakobranchus ocellatus]|uniref:Uncharacterized protein n=1 Tax=Plakobranchus ocellatus TaxID=259542 RepID=A0AAV3ZCI0_9GAST|nr:hypothetical protein PoB_001959400 [Plakobranchus ocellatus]
MNINLDLSLTILRTRDPLEFELMKVEGLFWQHSTKSHLDHEMVASWRAEAAAGASLNSHDRNRQIARMSGTTSTCHVNNLTVRLKPLHPARRNLVALFANRHSPRRSVSQGEEVGDIMRVWEKARRNGNSIFISRILHGSLPKHANSRRGSKSPQKPGRNNKLASLRSVYKFVCTQKNFTMYSTNSSAIVESSPQQGDLRLSGPPSGQGANGGAQIRDRKVSADLRADSLATVIVG